MLMGEIDLWRLFDIIGTLAFAVSGTLVGLSRRMDIFGISVLALATAVGGGMVCDILVGITPPMALRDTTNFLLSIGVALSTSFLYQWTELHHMHRQRLLTIFNVSDTIGLAAFTITGALTGIRFGGTDSYVLPILLAATMCSRNGCPSSSTPKSMRRRPSSAHSCSVLWAAFSASRPSHGSPSSSSSLSASLRSTGTGASIIPVRPSGTMRMRRRNNHPTQINVRPVL